MKRTIRGFDYRSHKSIELPAKEVRRLIAEAKKAGLLRRLAGEATVMHWKDGTLQIAVEYYDQDTSPQAHVGGEEVTHPTAE